MPRDPKHEQYYEANREHWDESTGIHERSQFYDRAGFIAGGRSPLTDTERAELGPLVAGKRLLHLQCHFGMDTLELARLGATVTGIDFSPASIEAAKRLSVDSGIPGRFIEANVYDAPEVLDERFDIVYAGAGSLVWLPDVRAWARVAAHFLEPGGVLYLYDGNPMRGTLADDRDDGLLVVETAYFETDEPAAYDDTFTYTDGPPMTNHRDYEWGHGLGEVVTAVADAGLRLDFLHEHREAPWQPFTFMEPVPGARMWRLADRPERLPMMYSLRATKPLA